MTCTHQQLLRDAAAENAKLREALLDGEVPYPAAVKPLDGGPGRVAVHAPACRAGDGDDPVLPGEPVPAGQPGEEASDDRWRVFSLQRDACKEYHSNGLITFVLGTIFSGSSANPEKNDSSNKGRITFLIRK